MPDTYKTFLSPGSCQLEITDLVAAANDDTGIDLYGVAWEIEQVLIAGEGFAAAPTDVWVNERGVLNIGQSLFDKINRTAEDTNNVPGQCTVVVKATSLVDSSKVARMKVLVGYPGEGGGGGGGGGATTTTITLLELLNGDASDQLKLTIETLDGETIEATSTTIIVEGGECPAFTFEVDAGAVVTLTADSGLTLNENMCMYGSGFDQPVENVYPSSIDYATSTIMTLVATNINSYVLVEIATDE